MQPCCDEPHALLPIKLERFFSHFFFIPVNTNQSSAEKQSRRHTLCPSRIRHIVPIVSEEEVKYSVYVWENCCPISKTYPNLSDLHCDSVSLGVRSETKRLLPTFQEDTAIKKTVSLKNAINTVEVDSKGVCVDKDGLTPGVSLVQYEVFQSSSHGGVMDSSDTVGWLPQCAITSVDMYVALGVTPS